MEGYDNNTYQQTDAKETQWFWTKYGIQKKKKNNEKTEWINHITRELKELEEGPKAEIHIDLLKTKSKMYQTEMCLARMKYMVSGYRNSPPLMTY